MGHSAAARSRPVRDLPALDKHVLSGVLDALRANIAVLDPTGMIVFVNAAWREYGESHELDMPQSGLGANYFEICAQAADAGDEDAAAVSKLLRDLADGRTRHGSWEYPCHSPTVSRWFILRASRFEVEGLSLLVLSHDDITERHMAEETLRRSYDALEAFNLAVSHDIRAPLRRIEQLSQIAEESNDEGKVEAQVLRRIAREADHAQALATDLLDLARVGELQVSLEHVDLTAIAEGIIARLRTFEPEREADVTIEQGLTLVADDRVIRLVLTNLLANAWKFSADAHPTRIEVGVEVENERRVFFVRDNGVGFDDAQAIQLFQPFSRLETGRGFEGTGVGLAIVRRALARLDGTVWANGSPGDGATFRFAIPGA